MSVKYLLCACYKYIHVPNVSESDTNIQHQTGWEMKSWNISVPLLLRNWFWLGLLWLIIKDYRTISDWFKQAWCLLLYLRSLLEYISG